MITEPAEREKRIGGPFQTDANANNSERTHAVLGIDAEGGIHHLVEHEARIVVIRDGEIELEQRMSETQLDEDVAAWFEFVADRGGWRQRRYVTASNFAEDMAALDRSGREQEASG